MNHLPSQYSSIKFRRISPPRCEHMSQFFSLYRTTESVFLTHVRNAEVMTLSMFLVITLPPISRLPVGGLKTPSKENTSTSFGV